MCYLRFRHIVFFVCLFVLASHLYSSVLHLVKRKNPVLRQFVWHPEQHFSLWAGTCSGTPGSSHRLAWHVLGCLSKQIKGVRALKDDGGFFYVLPQAAVAPIGLEEWVMGLKHSACSQMQGTLYRTSKCSIIYILVIHYGIFNGKKLYKQPALGIIQEVRKTLCDQLPFNFRI